MSSGPEHQSLIEQQAADWFTRLHSGDISLEEREHFEAWLHHDRAHKIAYRDYEQIYRDLDYVALEAGLVSSVSHDTQPRVQPISMVARMRKPVVAAAAAAMAIAAAAVMVFMGPDPVVEPDTTQIVQRLEAPDFQTDLAEIRELVLGDGSVVTLGPKSQIETQFTETRRQVTLLEGEAFFDIVTDPARPFFVSAQDTLVRVVGTKFDVKRSAEIVHVSVLEGIVEVMKPVDMQEVIESRDTTDIEKQVLTAGERVSAARRVALPEVRQVEQVEPGAWREGRLAYEDASLAEIVADLNRYHDRTIRFASSDVGDFRSTLAFRAGELDQVLDVLSAIHPIQVETSDAGDITLSRQR